MLLKIQRELNKETHVSFTNLDISKNILSKNLFIAGSCLLILFTIRAR